MKRLIYIAAEGATLFLVLISISTLFVWLWRGFDDVAMILLAVCSVPLLAGSVKLVLVGNHHSVWTGLYRPVRPLAMILPGIFAMLATSTLPIIGHRRAFVLDYSGATGVASYDLIEALSKHLDRKGIAHSKAGGLLVEDNGTTWWIEAEFGANRLTGWVESCERGNREQIIDGVRGFLVREMHLEVAA